MSENTRKRTAYPTRGFTIADEEWNRFKNLKEKNGGNWTQFIKHINNLLEGTKGK